jgi:hypothetical protein
MKNFILILSIFTLFALNGASADHTKISIGKPRHLQDNVGPFFGIGIGAGVIRIDEHDFVDHDVDPVMNIRAGFRINDYIALLVTSDFSMEDEDKEHWELYDDYDGEFQAFSAGIEVQVPITDATRIHAMFGNSYWQIQHEVDNERFYDRFEKHGTSSMVRAGITHYIDDNFSLNLEYMRPDMDVIEYEQITLGFTVTF